MPRDFIVLIFVVVAIEEYSGFLLVGVRWAEKHVLDRVIRTGITDERLGFRQEPQHA